jgi:hypothetical protein
VDLDTVYDNRFDVTLLEALPANNVVEIRGFTDRRGEILATRIALDSLAWAGETFEISGLTDQVSESRFMIGKLLIKVPETLTLTMPSEGNQVLVTGQR